MEKLKERAKKKQLSSAGYDRSIGRNTNNLNISLYLCNRAAKINVFISHTYHINNEELMLYCLQYLKIKFIRSFS
jgi:hypothetical protein